MCAMQYRVTIRGHLSTWFCRSFDGLDAEHVGGDTVLVGDIRDASALYGLVERCRDLGLELVGLEQVRR
jgi:hypothetical protein